jgi:hypothetical protein
MTREEHIYQLKQYLQGKSISMCPSSSLYWQEHWEEVIKALEQDPILDKIRAEIDKIYEREGNSVDCLNALDELKEFIDKYKAESEDKK